MNVIERFLDVWNEIISRNDFKMIYLSTNQTLKTLDNHIMRNKSSVFIYESSENENKNTTWRCQRFKDTVIFLKTFGYAADTNSSIHFNCISNCQGRFFRRAWEIGPIVNLYLNFCEVVSEDNLLTFNDQVSVSTTYNLLL